MKKTTLVLAGMCASASVFAGGLISPTELNEIKDEAGVVVLDYRWDTVPEKTVPGAMAMQNKDIARTADGVPGMILPQAEFEAFMSSLGVNNTDTLVLVDDEGMMNATRMWWVLKSYGHQGEIFVLSRAWPNCLIGPNTMMIQHILPNIEQQVIDEASEWMLMHGVAIKNRDATARHCPYSLAPVGLPRALFEQLK